MESLKPPSLRDVMIARNSLRDYFAPSPLLNYPALDRLVGTRVFLKHENLLPTGSFKVRGATHLISRLTGDERRRGVIAASTGNFSQGVVYAASRSGVPAKIVMPEGSNHAKIEATRALGGEIIFHGSKFDDARKHAEELAEKEHYRYIHSANEPDLVSGVGTHTYEIMESLPDVSSIIVPIGGGSGAAGAITVAKAFDREIKVIGVQSEESPAAFESWKNGRVMEAGNHSFAEGVATGMGYEFTQSIMRGGLDDFLLVSDREIRDAMGKMFNATRMVTESASSSTLVAAMKLGKKVLGENAVLIITGGNVPEDQLKSIISGVRV